MMKTQGTPTKQSFNVDTSNFTVEFTVNTSVKAPSVAYLCSEYYYENGLEYTFTDADGTAMPESSFTARLADNRLTFTVTDTAYDGKTITLNVVKK